MFEPLKLKHSLIFFIFSLYLSMIELVSFILLQKYSMAHIKILHKQKKHLARLCLENHLYINGKALQAHFKIILEDNELKKLYCITAAVLNGKAIGVLIYVPIFSASFIFVKPEYRRKKIGTALFKEIQKLCKKKFSKYIRGESDKRISLLFYQSLNMTERVN
jgi:GNAT superfamily N-acetyltransferase